MMNTKKNHAPFGIRSERFQNLGLHPGFESGGGTRKFPFISPGSYDPALPEKSFFQNGWSRSLETEEFSKNLGFFSADYLKRKIRAKESNGPGWHDCVFPRYSTGITFPKADRLSEPDRVDTPGPGFYRKDRRPRCSFGSKIPPFDRGNLKSRISSSPSFSIPPPNLYRVPDFVDLLLRKVVSKRGPYDLFTGSRDETTLYGHFRKSEKNRADALYSFPGGTDILRSGPNLHKGKFMRCGRNSVPPTRISSKKNPDDPGPAHYHLPSFPEKIDSESVHHPFGSSLLYARPPTKIGLKPGPGKYNDKKTANPIKGNGWKSSFLSKTKSGGPPKDKHGWFQ